jgi:hypothetical protein
LTSASGQVVATFHRVNQTGPIGPITIYTPSQWGTYRVSISMVLAVGNGDRTGASWESDLQFKNQAGNSHLFVVLPVRMPQNALSEFPIRAQAGKPINITVISNGNTAGTKYNIWVAVELLM